MSELDQPQYELDSAPRSLAGWWTRLTDGSWRLFLYHLAFLPFFLPVYLGLILFILFHAWVPLLCALVLLFPAGPAFLSLFEAVSAIADGALMNNMPHFFSVYKKRWREGLALSLVLFTVVLFTLCPVYFAFATGSAARFLISISAATALLLFFSILPYAMQLLLIGKWHGLVREAVSLSLNSAKTSLMLGILQMVCMLFTLLSPYIAAFAILLGMPAVTTLSIVYFLPGRDQQRGKRTYEPEE